MNKLNSSQILTDKDYKEIRADKRSQHTIARERGISQTHVWRIKNNLVKNKLVKGEK